MSRATLAPQASALLWDLSALDGPTLTIERLQRRHGWPRASIRRSVAELKAAGYDVRLASSEVTLWPSTSARSTN